MKINLKKMTLGALLAALVILAILILHIPTALGGYIHVGDSIILLSSILGPGYGAFVGGVGAFFADILAGAPTYAPFSLVIHGVQGLVFGFFFIKNRNMGVIKFMIFGFIISLITVVGGYFIVDLILSGGQLLAATGDVIGNLVQITFGTLIGGLLFLGVGKILKKVE